MPTTSSALATTLMSPPESSACGFRPLVKKLAPAQFAGVYHGLNREWAVM